MQFFPRQRIPHYGFDWGKNIVPSALIDKVQVILSQKVKF